MHEVARICQDFASGSGPLTQPIQKLNHIRKNKVVTQLKSLASFNRPKVDLLLHAEILNLLLLDSD